MNHISILDSRKKEWMARKTWWNLSTSIGREKTISRAGGFGYEPSIFDPVVAELFYSWYCPEGGSILDPFAGGPARGVVAQELGCTYTGIDISEAQVEANKQFGVDCILGDSEAILPTLDQQYDLAFTCPPYHNLEIYTDHSDDLSTLDWDSFKTKYASILRLTFDQLKDNRFMVLVVSEIRDAAKLRDYKIGKYRGLVPFTIQAAEEAGFHYYNDFVLLNHTERASKIMNRIYKSSRKVARAHQNILVFIKGNPDIAAMDLDKVEGCECEIDGIPYRTFKEAAINTDTRLSGADIKTRCNSKKWTGYIKKEQDL